MSENSQYLAENFVPGTIIRNRNRLWRVDGQDGKVLIASSIDASHPEQFKFYLPLENVEIGKLEPPDPRLMGNVQSQELLLRAYRLSMLHSSAPMLSLQRSRVIPKDYQLVPVVMALEMPRVRMLIADDVGLGKTIEAGLILTELMARGLANRILVVVPANLREQWREALDYFFHIDAPIMSARHRRGMERELTAGANPWEYYNMLITSIDYAKRTRQKYEILEQEWDVVIVDEAHLAAKPHQSGPDQAVSMDRYGFVKELSLSKKVRHLLLLTATPHNGYTDSFASLIRMLDVDAVKGPPHAPRILRNVAKRYVCQRRRKDIEAWFASDPSKSPFPERDQEEVVVPPSSYEKDAIDAVEAYGDTVLESALGQKRFSILAHWTVLHLHKRALSSPEALRQSLKNRKESLEQRLQSLLESEAEAGVTRDEARANVLDEDTGERLTDEEAGVRLERASYGSKEQIEAELAILEDVTEKAAKVTKSRDSKLNKLLDVVLREMLAREPHVIIFTRFVDTLKYLEKKISGDSRYADAEVITIHGGNNERQRAEKFKAFERAKQGILVATDAISEGINLQHAASQVIHYELPWNPNRLEQRNGRVDRFGQKKPMVYIRTLVMDETLDAAILMVLIEKANRIRRDYGFSPPYFGDERSIVDLLLQHDLQLTPKQLSFFDDWKSGGVMEEAGELEDPFSDESLNRIRDESFYGQTEVELPEIEGRLEATNNRVGSPEEIQKFVFSGLSRFGCAVSEVEEGVYNIHLTNPALQVVSIGEEIKGATFDIERALDDPDLDALDIGHPLVRRLIEEVKQNAFLESEHYGRSSHIVTPDVEEVTGILHVLARYSVGTEPASVVEELVQVGIPLDGGELILRDELESLLNAIPTAERISWADEDLESILSMNTLDALLQNAAQERRKDLVEDRTALRQRMLAGAGDLQALTWLDGIDDLALASYDLLAVQLLYPKQLA